MTASRNPSNAIAVPSDTACPPRRSFVAGDARRRGQACREVPPTHTAFGDSLPTPSMLAGVDKLWSSMPIADA